MDDSAQLMNILQLIITGLAAIGASSGFWIFVDRKRNNREAMNKLLIGLAHDRIVFLAMKYIERGFITQEEHENLYEFLYCPYKDLGGNGSAIRLMGAINRLPLFDTQNHIDEKMEGEKSDLI